MNHHLFRLLLISFLILNACKKDNSFLKDSGSLNFSKDTIYFDTVFTKLPNSNLVSTTGRQHRWSFIQMRKGINQILFGQIFII